MFSDIVDRSLNTVRRAGFWSLYHLIRGWGGKVAMGGILSSFQSLAFNSLVSSNIMLTIFLPSVPIPLPNKSIGMQLLKILEHSSCGVLEVHYLYIQIILLFTNM